MTKRPIGGKCGAVIARRRRVGIMYNVCPRRYGAKVSTRPSQGRNPGSTPGTATIRCVIFPMLVRANIEPAHGGRLARAPRSLIR